MEEKDFLTTPTPGDPALHLKRLLRRGALVIATASHSLITIAGTPCEAILYFLTTHSATAIQPESPNVQKQCALPWLHYRCPHPCVEETHSCVTSRGQPVPLGPSLQQGHWLVRNEELCNVYQARTPNQILIF